MNVAGAQAPRALRHLGVAVLASIALLPLLPLLSKALPGAAPLEHALNAWFVLHCQRDPARSLSLAQVPLAVCARCSGIYFGLGAGAALRRPRLTARALRLWVMAAAAFMLLDVALEARGLHGSWPFVRLLSGVLLAYPVGAGLGHAVLAGPDPDPAQSP